MTFPLKVGRHLLFAYPCCLLSCSVSELLRAEELAMDQIYFYTSRIAAIEEEITYLPDDASKETKAALFADLSNYNQMLKLFKANSEV